ncbi:MAG: helix-turn-helix domain-containing protein [Herpetosiphonaceae bacterium]|nr:helix-turn-helix domain-containing protein [Herpetosiphonaceae bacterium]
MTFPDVLTLEETAEYLRLPPAVIEHEAVQGHIPGRRIAESWRFLRTALDDWLRRYDGRTLLVQQAGAFADDPTLTHLRTTVYSDRGRTEAESGTEG